MKEQLQEIFTHGYPGAETFLQKVIVPILGDDVTAIDSDLLDSPKIRQRAANANISSARYVADIDRVDSAPIAFYDVTLKPGAKIEHSRVAIRQFITSEMMNFTHGFILFHYENEPDRPWRFSYVYKTRSTSDARATAKRYTYVFGKDYRSRTAVERFEALAHSPKSDADFEKAFSVEALGDEFFDRYRDLYADFVQFITGKRYVKDGTKWVERVMHDPDSQHKTSFGSEDKLVRDYIKKMFGRIVFLYFLQRKGWLAGNRNYMHDLFADSDKKDNFLDGVLGPLFFELLNTRPEHRCTAALALPGGKDIPYLNGGLFQNDEIDARKCVFPENYFKRLFDFFDQYNFTIDENDPEDAEVGIDPEMLGRIFENLLEDNKDKGAFYTPKEIVDYMCRESIIAYLLNGIPERSHELIRNFVETLDSDTLNEEQRKFLKMKLLDVKICDPAIGSGAFPMGMVNILSKIYLALGMVSDRSKMKRHIMAQSIYGVDIEKGAVDIARLRFWLAMVVDATVPEPLPNLHFKIMQGNSLLESYKRKDLSRLTEVNIGDSGCLDLQNEEAISLNSSLNKYYGESNHEERDKIFNDIINNVRRQIFGITQSEEFMTDIKDLSANDQFFLWHTWFSDVFAKGGFDIVIGNPPYIDSETMTNNGLEGMRDYITETYDYVSGNWDIYMAFFEKAIKISKNVVCFITPDKWLSKPFGKKFRAHCLSKKLSKIVHAGSDVFDSATVDAIISLFITSSQSISAFVFNRERKVESRGSMISSELKDPYLIDSLFSPYASLISKIEAGKDSFLLSIAKCEGACSTGDAYKLIPLISEVDDSLSYRLVNTGTLDKFSSKWGIKPISYLKKDLGYQPLKPLVNIAQFEGLFGNAYITKAKGPKIIMKGLNLLDAFVDEQGIYLPGKTTLVINSTNVESLFFLSAILNSSLSIFYIKNKYSSSSYCGGITFTKDMINQLPIPSLEEWERSKLITLAQEATLSKQRNNNASISHILKEIDVLINKAFKLSYDEVLIADPETSITREEYGQAK